MAKRTNGEGTYGTTIVNGKEYVRLRKTYDGKRKDFLGRTKAECKKKAEKYELSKHIDLDKKLEGYSFYQYAHQWLTEWRNSYGKELKDKTKNYYSFYIEGIIKESVLSSIPIKTLNKDSYGIFQKLVNDYASKHSKSSTNGLHATLSQVCKYGFTHDDFAYNFMEKVEKITESKCKNKTKNKKALSVDQFNVIFAECMQNPSIYRYAIIFSCLTGLRIGELSALQWKDVKDDVMTINKQYVYLPHNGYKIVTPKSEKSNRTVTLNTAAIEVLSSVKTYTKRTKPDNLIFNMCKDENSLVPLHNSNCNKALKKLLDICNIDSTGISFHSCRDTFATLILHERPELLVAVSDALGHSSIRVTTDVYVKSQLNKKREATSVFDDIIKK